MASLKPDLSNLQTHFETLLNQHNVVGASVAVLANNTVYQAAAGKLNITTDVEVTPDSLFQIGSISKVFTATVVMQLVDEGKIELDLPIKQYLPDFIIADRQATNTITVRQLLNHTSGMEGDFFPEDNLSGPSTKSYLTKCHRLPQLHPVGEYLSYCNSGYVWLGRLLETLDRKPWAQAVLDRLIKPLTMEHTFADPAESLRYRVAMGHAKEVGSGATVLANRCYIPLSAASAGSLLTMSAADLLSFGRLHLEGGKPPQGKTLLSAEAVSAMQTSQFALPELSWRRVTDWCLGWFMRYTKERRFYGHDGATRGQFSYLRVYPEQKLAYVLLTNSPSRPLFQALEQSMNAALLLSPDKKQNAVDKNTNTLPAPFDPKRYIGCYQNLGARLEVTCEDGQIKRRVLSNIDAVLNKEERLTYLGGDRFAGEFDGDAVFF